MAEQKGLLLAEQGDVCVMFGDTCCTFLPNNNAAYDPFTEALTKLETLGDGFKEEV